MNSKQFVAKIVADNQALFQASQHNVRAYFDSKPAQEELVDHFIGRMVNERMNICLLYTSPSPRDRQKSRMPSSA